MKEPRRLIADEAQSPMMNELLRAARKERLPEELRSKMAGGLALTLGGTSLGAGLAVSSQAQGALAGAQQVGALGTASSATLTGATVGQAGAAAAAGAKLAGSAGSSSLGLVWVKGAVALTALTGMVGVGGVFGGWFEGSADPSAVSSGKAVSTEIGSANTHRVGTRAEPIGDGEPSTGDVRGQTSLEPLPAAAPVQPTARSGGKDTQAENKEDVPARAAQARRPFKTYPAGDKVEAPGDLGREVRLLDAARQAILAGDAKAAREKLAVYGRVFPQGALRAEAAALAKAVASAP